MMAGKLRAWWRESGRGELVAGAVLLAASYAAVVAWAPQVPRSAGAWVLEIVVAVVAAACYRLFFGLWLPERVPEGGPGSRALFAMVPLWLVVIVRTGWLAVAYVGGSVTTAAAVTAAAGAMAYRWWWMQRRVPKGAPLLPSPVRGPGALAAEALGLLLVIAGAVIGLVEGERLSSSLKPLFVRWTERLPGGQLAVAGQMLEAAVATQLVGLVFAFLVTNALLYALVDGLLDWRTPRTTAYAATSLPFLIALGWSAHRPGLLFECLASLFLLAMFWRFSRQHPRAALDKLGIAQQAARRRPRLPKVLPRTASVPWPRRRTVTKPEARVK